MRTEDEVTLSLYTELSCIDGKSNVYLVQHTETKQKYIRKTRSVYDKELYLELQKLQVPGVPEIYHIIEDGGHLTIIEEYIKGEMLSDFLSRCAPLPVSSATGYIRKLCAILAPLHKAEPAIIHRDIKPENIILTADNRLFLIDFNAARLYGPDKTEDTVLMGTVDYAAPEQYGFGQSDARTDIYALGILLNLMLTGAFPKQKLYDGDLSFVISKCINMDPAKRYASVQELEEALRFQTSGQKTSRRYVPPGFRTRNKLKMIFSIFGYAGIAGFCALMDMDYLNSTFLAFVNRAAIFCFLLSIVLIAANYMNIQSKLLLARSSFLPVKILGICLWTVISLFFFLTLTVLIEGLYGS